MKNTRRGSKQQDRSRSQVSGPGKDAFIRRALHDTPGLDDELAGHVAEHLSRLIDIIKTDKAIIERYKAPKFDPNGFSVMKVFRNSGEEGLRGRLNEIGRSQHLQELAKAQQISLPRPLRGKSADLSALREAIVKGARRRYEDWDAAS